MEKDPHMGPLIDILLGAKNITVLTGAGISTESGIPTFRGKEGLWKQYRAEDLATPVAFAKDPKLVWQWYDWRRCIIGAREPNSGHIALALWEKAFPSFHIITQNIDGLHQKAGSKNVLELHGNIWKLRCTKEGTLFENQDFPLEEIPPCCPECGALLRPHVVWFGESLSSRILNDAFRLSGESDVVFVVGTSSVVQPAASLPLTAKEAGAVIVEINPNTTPLTEYADFSFRGESGKILPQISRKLNPA